MRDLVRANAQMFSVRTVSDSASTQDTSITADRARLRSVYLIDTSRAVAGVGAVVGINALIQFKDGDNSGSVLLKLYPNLVAVYAALWDAHGVFVEFPGSGILFPSGIHAEVSFDATGTEGIPLRGLAATVVYS